MREMLKDQKLIKKLIKRRYDAILLITANTGSWGERGGRELIKTL